MKTIVIASENPVKIHATLGGFRRMFPGEDYDIQPISVSNGVGTQPLSDRQTLQGALNRARAAVLQIREADYWVGIEGGVQDEDGEMAAFAWIVVMSHVLVGKSRSGSFVLPSEVADLVRQGKELGTADDIVFDRAGSKQGIGAVGILTGNIIDRTQLYEHAVILALVPFKNATMYSALPSGISLPPVTPTES